MGQRPQAGATAAAQTLALRTIESRAGARKPTLGVVLGSGWGGLTRHITEAVRIPYADLAGFPTATVPGHAAELWLGFVGRQSVAVLSGRSHAYESGAADAMQVPLDVLRALGCQVLLQTNAAGSLRANMAAGSLMLVCDHINFPQRSPLQGAAGAERFVNMTDAYDPALRELAMAVAARQGLQLHQGVYLWALGPQFETPAEIRMFAGLGADAVGMSTVPETILARHAGLRVLALSLITNMGAGLSQERLSHDLTLANARASSEHASGFLAALIGALAPTLQGQP